MRHVTAFYSTSLSIPPRPSLLISGFALAKIDMMEGRKKFSLLLRKLKVKMNTSIKLPPQSNIVMWIQVCKWRTHGCYKVKMILGNFLIFLPLVKNLMGKGICFVICHTLRNIREGGSLCLVLYQLQNTGTIFLPSRYFFCGSYNATSPLFWNKSCAIGVLFM